MKQFKDYFDSVPSLETERFILGPFPLQKELLPDKKCFP